jgi:N-methylhydantoinase A/oxoprolinase/acetone carboxylase beta subunit
LNGWTWQLDVEASKRAVNKVATRLSMSIMDAAKGIIDIVNEKMGGALRRVAVAQGTCGHSPPPPR